MTHKKFLKAKEMTQLNDVLESEIFSWAAQILDALIVWVISLYWMVFMMMQFW